MVSRSMAASGKLENHDMQISDYERQSPNKRGSHIRLTNAYLNYCRKARAISLASLSAALI